MKIFLLFIYLLHGINCSELKKYLNDQAKIVGERLIRHARNQENIYTVKFNDINSVELIGNYSTGEIFTFFNKSYALMDRELFQISQNYSLVHTFLIDENVIFLKTTEFKNVGFLMFATKSSNLHILGFHRTNENFFKIQNIAHLSITDATFFICQNELYLLVSSYKSPDFTTIVLYKFVQSHFDETETILTSSVTKLHTFPNNGSQIIIVLQKYGVTSLYEFKQDKIRKIHKIDTTNPDQVLNYIYMGKQYVLIFSGTDVTLYLWTGSDLLLLEQFTSDTAVKGKRSIVYVEDNPYLIVSNKSNFVIFGLVSNQFVLGHDFVYNTNWTDIWTYKTINQGNILIALGPNTQNVEIRTISISIQAKLLQKTVDDDEKLPTCFLNLEKSLYSLRNKLTDVEKKTDEVLREAADETLQDGFPLRKLKQLETKYLTMKATFEDRMSKKLVINQTAEVDLPFGAKEVIAKDLRFDNVNNQKWQPDRWLSYSAPQKISGTVKTHLLDVDKLETNESDPLLNDLLLSRGNQILSGFIDVNNLKAKEVDTNLLNNISVNNLYYKSQPVIIQGVKTFPHLVARNLEIDNINGNDGSEVVKLLFNLDKSRYIFPSNLTVDNLWVDNINGINFDNFKNSVFRIGEDTIDGNLAIANVRAKNMTFDTLSKMSNVLTTSTNQTISSSIQIRSIYTINIKTNRINGMNFKDSVAILDKPNNVIYGPVSIRHLNVKNNLELKGNVETEFLLLNNTHVVGTNESDFLQRYTRSVKIKGNLFVKNLDLDKTAKIVIADTEFDPKMDQFWTKSTQQTIPTHFEAQNGVSTSHIYTSLINGVDVNDYLLNSTQQKKATKFYFDNVTIKGNVLLNPDERHTPDLERIQQESVKINGVYKIEGHKTYTNILKVDRLEVNQLSGGGVPEEFTKETDLRKTVPKIRNLVIKGNLTSKKIYVDEINNVNLTDLLETSVYIDRPQNLSYLSFESVTAQNINVTFTLNRIDIEELTELFDLKKIDKITNVYVNNNVTIKNVEELSTINNQDIHELLRRSRSQYNNGTFFGPVKFHGNVKVKDFYVIMVNNINLQKLSERILYKSWNQAIKGYFTFTKLTANGLIAEQINDFNVSNIVDIATTEPQEFFATNGLKMSKRVKIQNLVGQFECDIRQSLINLRNPPSQFWNNILVTGNVTFMDKHSLISRIFDEVVTRQNSRHVIKNKVSFTNHISANNVTARKNINNIDIMEIINDAFLNNPDIEQVIRGEKRFIALEAEELISLQNTIVSTINEIDISEIDTKIISKHSSILDVPIKGRKVFFGGLQAKNIQTDFISGVETKNLVSFENADKIPSAMFESISVKNNFNITFVNGMPFEVLLNERLLAKSSRQVITGNYFFHDVTFSENVVTPQINDIKMENVIFDGGVQNITSLKTFVNDLKIVGNTRIEILNGLKLSESYEKAVLNTEETNFTGIVQFLKPALIDGNISTKYINGVPIEYMLDTNAELSLQVEAQQIHSITKTISEFVHKYLNTTIRMPTEIMYLQKSADLQISIPNTISAHIVKTKDDVLIHVESEEDGDFCGLPQTCKCPMQQTMQISSEQSINVFINKATQRIYSYYDDDIIVHLITRSISSSTYCRTSKTKVMNEVSTLTWNVPPQKNSTGGFFVHRTFLNGFISGAEFFTIYGRTYIVIGNYYDPVLDTHNVDTLVLRFNEEKTAIEEIQKIPTFGVKTISLFPTAQGVVLILGSDLTDEINSTSTEIYRFDYEQQQFELLRKVPTFRCLFAEGIVLEIDSLIILADKHSRLLVLKYRLDFDNYYLYQSFQLEYPVSSMSVFYSEGFGISDAYLTVVTSNNEYFIYSFRFIEGWKLEFSGELHGTKVLVPFKLNEKSYLFAPSNTASSLFTLVKHDSD